MNQETLQLTTGGKKDQRRSLDFYPTPPEVTIALMDFLKLKPCKIWECACGDGAMAKVIRQYDLDGNLLKTYVSFSDAKKHGFLRKGICKNIDGRTKNYNGFIWKQLI